MAFLAYLANALLTAILAMFVAGFVGVMAVDWYNISGFEGGSGYFVVFLAILGFFAGIVIAIVVTTIARRRLGFLRTLGLSLAVVIVLGALGGGATRLLADIPPQLDGEPMLLAVEMRWPAGRTEAPTAAGPDEASISLHSIPLMSSTVRASERGPLWMQDARQVDGRWVVPGAVSIFTSRGSRMLSVEIGDKNNQGFSVPLPGYPGRKDLEWSDWLPEFRPGVVVPPDLLSFRYRAVKAGEPIRSETVGPFEIAISTAGFYPVQRNQRTVFGAHANFHLRYRGQPVAIAESIDDVAILAGERPAFLIHVDPYGSNGACMLAAEVAGQARVERIADCYAGLKGRLLTSDPARFAADDERPVEGRIDRTTYARPGVYLLTGDTVFDTRTLGARRFTSDSNVTGIPAVPPLALSPDERSFVRFANSGYPESRPLLLVTDTVVGRSYTLPVDPARMRYAKLAALDPAWLDHHFMWQRNGGGVDVLVERTDFKPLPYRGELSLERDGYRTYRVEKGTEALRGALLDFLVAEFGAKLQPAEAGAYELPVTIGDKTVNVAFSTDFGYLGVSMERGVTQDTSIVAEIGSRFDAALATGRYDDLFATKAAD